MSGRIVVGVDGSQSSRNALHFAWEEARRRDARVDVVYAYSLPVASVMPGYMGPAVMPSVAELEKDAQEMLASILDSAPTDIRMESITVRGPAAPTLLDISRGAELLVVGSRGRGGFRGLLLGSTSHQVITHAPCPVVVVPASDADD